MSLEFPAGLRDKGESVEQAAVRELAEETGFEGRITVSTLIPLLNVKEVNFCPSVPGLAYRSNGVHRPVEEL